MSPCSSTRAKLLETQEGLVRAKRGFTSKEESNDYFGKGEDNSDKVFHLYQGNVKWLEGETFAGVTSEPGGGVRLDCSRSQVCRIQEESVQYLYYESVYKGRGITHVRGLGSVHRGCNDT